MFETEIHRWLQTFNAPLMEYVMRGISILGEEEFLAGLMLAVIFGVERRRGFLLTQTLLWTALISSVLKGIFALPRPVDVDALVRDITTERNVPTPFTARGATGFWGLLPDDVVAYFRSVPQHISYGFPSGHCSTTFAVSGSAAILWRKTWLLLIAASIVILMPLSRMYLGRHFLADVLGGLAVGTCAILLLILIVRDAPTIRTGRLAAAARIVGLFALPLGFVLLAPGAPANEAAMLLGINIGQFGSRRMLPTDPASRWWQRLLTVGAAGTAFILLIVAIRIVLRPLGSEVAATFGLLGRVVAPFGAIMAGTFAAARFARRNHISSSSTTSL